MLSLSRGLTFGLLIAGVALFVTSPTELRAQAKKDAKKEPPPPVKKEAAPAKKEATPPKKDAKTDDSGERTVAFGTSDGLTLKGYWYQGIGLDKQRPDAVMMFPAPGGKVTDAWIDLAKKLSEKNFSVLLFDWRGCGMNGPEAGARVFENADVFWREPYSKALAGRRASIENKGLDYSYLKGATTDRLSYRDFMLNDLMGARFFLDKMNDDKKCNTNRTWIVSEKDGVQLGVAFIATEFRRNSIFSPVVTPTIGIQQKPAGRDYAGVVALSYAGGNPTATKVFRNALSSNDGLTKDFRNHLETRLATVLIYTKKDGISASKGLVSQLGVGGDDKQMKDNFKYLREVDVKDKPVSGIAMVDPMDTFGVKATILEAMVGISKAQPFGRDATDREANKMTDIPRFRVENYARP